MFFRYSRYRRRYRYRFFNIVYRFGIFGMPTRDYSRASAALPSQEGGDPSSMGPALLWGERVNVPEFLRLLTCAHKVWETTTKFCTVLKLHVRIIFTSRTRMLTRDLFSVANVLDLFVCFFSMNTPNDWIGSQNLVNLVNFEASACHCFLGFKPSKVNVAGQE